MSDQKAEHTEQPLVSHLVELRNRILRSFAAVLILFLVMFPWSNDIYLFVAEPLMRLLGEDESLISTSVTGTFFAPFKLTFMVAVFVAIPFLLYQAWAFVAPGLYQNEIRVTFPLLVSSVILFYVGLAFCYYVVLGFLYQFFVSSAPEGVLVMTDVNSLLDFALGMFFAFGVMFEIPVATVLLIMIGVTTPADLVEKRGYVVIACFVVGMFLTPPDPFSQSMLAIPMWMLFEIGVVAGRLIYKPDVSAPENSPEAEAK